MTNTNHSTPANEPTAADYLRAGEQVVCMLVNEMSPKRERRARAEIEAFLSHLETVDGKRLPANVIPIRARYRGSDAERRDNLRLAAAVRQVAAPVLS